jgi:hypothetical protein
MTRTKWMFLGAALLLIAPIWADNVYYAGFEDSVGGDYDYNDLVLSLSGEGLQLIPSSPFAWSSEPTLGTSGSPFWNRLSLDGTNENVGNCIYGGSCPAPAGAAGLAPGDKYLATTAGGGPVNDVYFTVDGSVSPSVLLHIAGDTDLIGWYLLSDPTAIHWINSAGEQTGAFSSFDPGGAFGLVANNHDGVGGNTFYSQTGIAGATDDSFGSHFAFFGNPSTIPEPGTVMLMGTALLGISLVLRRRKKENAD